MDKIKKGLAVLAEKLHLTNGALVLQRSVVEHQGKVVADAHDAAVEAQKAADRHRRHNEPKKAQRQDTRSIKQHRKAEAARVRLQQAVGEVKRLTARQGDLEQDQAALQKELDALSGKVKIKGNHATGGTKRERLKAVALKAAAECAAGRRRNFYSQSGTWDVDHAITGEAYGHRSDCSSFVTAVYKAAGLPDPNGNRYGGGYTGTLGSHGRKISRNELKPGDLILYGPYPHHHVEMFVGPGVKTIGHGSAPVDAGVVDLLAGEKTYRSYVK